MNPFFLRLLATATLGLSLAACQSSSSSQTETAGAQQVRAAALLSAGPWRGVLTAQGQEIPFAFEVKSEEAEPVVYLINPGLNGEERLRCAGITAAGDSVTIRLHAFDAALVVRADGPGKLRGNWVKYDTKTPYRVPFTATKGAQALFPASPNAARATVAEGTFRTEFRDETGKTYPAVGIFKKTTETGEFTGTFLTSTGDYRYLAGQADGNRLRLSTFDGSHGFLFTAQQQPDGTLKGDFYAGKTGHETWIASPDPTAKLPDANTLTGMKPGQTRLDFKFPSIFEGGSISPTDPKYRGKVVVIQLLGSWCPNCMDETNFLAPWYLKNKARGVEVIGLGYERSADYKVAAARLRNMRERFKIGYDLAVAGVSNKDSAARSLPQLAQFVAFPTTIFLDKKGVVRKIHTGFAGPGTGKYYQQETAGFEQEVNMLLQE